MKISILRNVFCLVVLTSIFSLSTPAFGEDNDMLKQAEDVLHQAWNPAGDPPSNDQRTQLVTKALELTRSAPQRRVHHHRMQAMTLMRSALEEIKNGDPNKKVTGYLKDADSELREAISES